MFVNAFETIKRSGAALQNMQFCKVCVVSLRVENCETVKTNVWGSVKAITVETNGLTLFGSDGAHSQLGGNYIDFCARSHSRLADSNHQPLRKFDAGCHISFTNEHSDLGGNYFPTPHLV